MASSWIENPTYKDGLLLEPSFSCEWAEPESPMESTTLRVETAEDSSYGEGELF